MPKDLNGMNTLTCSNCGVPIPSGVFCYSCQNLDPYKKTWGYDWEKKKIDNLSNPLNKPAPFDPLPSLKKPFDPFK